MNEAAIIRPLGRREITAQIVARLFQFGVLATGMDTASMA